MSDQSGLESQYYEARAFDREHIRRVRSHFLQFVKGRKFLVELGSGRGEFLQDAAREVERAKGVDVEPAMAAEIRNLGLEAIQADALDYLRTTTDRPDVIFAAHLVEHLPIEQAQELISLSARVLEKGGRLILVTPNTECLAVMLKEFWTDPTHVRPYSTALLEFLMTESGLEVVESGPNPMDVPGPPPELLVHDVLEPWGELDASVLPNALLDDSRKKEIAAVQIELRRLREAVETLVHAIGELGRRVDVSRHQAQLATSGVNNLLRYLYAPNEVYVVGERNS